MSLWWSWAVAYLNMSDTTQRCPSSWNFTASPVRGCDRLVSNCDSVTFPSNGQSYSRVCGRVIGYQRGTTDAFNGGSLEGAYLDGVSITHGAAGSRQHIWSFVAALHDADPSYSSSFVCRCTNINQNWPYQVPSFIGNNYFCDTGNHGSTIPTSTFTEPIWDGTGCSATSTCCEFNNPPWFCTTLPRPTTNDLEVRNCGGTEAPQHEDVIINLIKLHDEQLAN